MVSQLVINGRHDGKWSLFCLEIAERSKLFAQLSDADKAKSFGCAFEEALDLGRALGFGFKECQEEFKKFFPVSDTRFSE